MFTQKVEPKILSAFLIVLVVSIGCEATELRARNSSDHLVDYKEIEAHNFYINKFFKNVLSGFTSVYGNLGYFSDDTQNKTHKLIHVTSSARNLSPVLLVPGYGGTKLEARWDRPKSEHKCQQKSDWRLMWCDAKSLVFQTRCMVETLMLVYDHETNTTRNNEGVEIRVKAPEELESVETVTERSIFGLLNYFTAISSLLVDKVGYKRNVNIRAAPYDFRKAPNEMAEYFMNMSDIIEQLFEENNGQPTTLICHSMGCNNVLYFLQRQGAKWKNKYVRRMISLAAPWAGSMNAFRAVALGDNLRLPWLLREQLLKIAQRSLPSTMYLFPNQLAFGNQPLIIAHKNDANNNSEEFRATPEDYEKFFHLLELPDSYKMYLQTKDLLRSLEAPGVEVWCLYGHKVDTLSQMHFDGEFPDSTETKLMADGDGTVSTVSLDYCRQWASQQVQPIHLRAYNFVNHLEILNDDDVLEQIDNILKADITQHSHELKIDSVREVLDYNVVSKET